MTQLRERVNSGQEKVSSFVNMHVGLCGQIHTVICAPIPCILYAINEIIMQARVHVKMMKLVQT